MNLKNTVYAQYVKERSNADILEDESGFIVYTISNGECFIHEMSVRQVVRGQGYGKSLIADLEKIAKENKCEAITANVHLWDKGAANTLTAAFKTGFELGRAENNTILIIKKLGGL